MFFLKACGQGFPANVFVTYFKFNNSLYTDEIPLVVE